MEIFRPAFKIGEFVMLLWGIAMLLPLCVAQENTAEIIDFSISAFCCFVLASFFSRLSGNMHHFQIKPRAMFLVTFVNWVLLCLTGSLPFILSELHFSFADALFESVSGVTTTGSTVMSGLDSVPDSYLLWRSITQWVGGIGIILMAVAILPFLKVGGMRLFKTESSEWSQLESGRIGRIASYIGLVYLCISLLCFVVYLSLGMTWFDALNHAMTTVSTGGFSTSDASFGKFHSPALLYACGFFMLLGSCPFLLYVTSIQNRSPLLFRDKQVRLLMKLVAVSAVIISAVRLLSHQANNLPDIITGSTFNVISIITTTGYASENYSLWGSFSVLLLGFLMFSGACSGSTCGGVKLFRFQLLAIFMREHTFSALHPNAQQSRLYNERPVREEVLVASMAFLFYVIISWLITSVLLALCGLDSITSITASLTALMNVGPGFGNIVGPEGNFGSLPNSAKYILAVAMLLGRLEYLTLVIVFTREFWRW